MTAPMRWPVETLCAAVSPLLPGFAVEVLPSVDSTNTELMLLAPKRRRAPAAHPAPDAAPKRNRQAAR
ncbi:hypothetical protein [Verminephrobacter aporrectodeae]